MDEAAKAGVAFNWSEVASEAFRNKLAALAIGDGPMRLQAIATRLKTTRDAKIREESEIGRADGRAWASLVADIRELSRLQALVNSDEWFLFWQQSVVTPAERLEAKIAKRPPNLERSAVFWAEVRAIEPSRAHIAVNLTPVYLSAFVGEALLVWNEVLPLLDSSD